MRAGRTVVSRNQDRINNPDIGDKGLDGKTVMEQALKIYQENTKTDPLLIDTSSRHGRLLRAQMDAIAEVMDSNQKTINQPGVGFKAFIPATFGRLVNEAFAKRVGSEAEMKITAPLDLVRNRKARPDDRETEVIRDKLLTASWPKGQLFATVATSRGRPALSRYLSITLRLASPAMGARRGRLTSPGIRRRAPTRATWAVS